MRLTTGKAAYLRAMGKFGRTLILIIRMVLEGVIDYCILIMDFFTRRLIIIKLLSSYQRGQTIKIIINGSKFKTQEEFHQLIKKELDLPDYYSENLDALWDCLTGYIEFPVFITWINYHQSKKFLGKEADIIAKTFEDAAIELTDLEFNKQCS